MSWPMRWFSKIFPFTYYTDLFLDQAMRGAPAVYSLKYLACIAMFVILPMLCLPRLKRVATDQKYWGRM